MNKDFLEVVRSLGQILQDIETPQIENAADLKAASVTLGELARLEKQVQKTQRKLEREQIRYVNVNYMHNLRQTFVEDMLGALRFAQSHLKLAGKDSLEESERKGYLAKIMDGLGQEVQIVFKYCDKTNNWKEEMGTWSVDISKKWTDRFHAVATKLAQIPSDELGDSVISDGQLDKSDAKEIFDDVFKTHEERRVFDLLFENMFWGRRELVKSLVEVANNLVLYEHRAIRYAEPMRH